MAAAAANLICFLAFPFLFACLYCRCSSAAFSLPFTALYMAGYAGISLLAFGAGLPGFLLLVLDVGLLTLWGTAAHKHQPAKAASISALVLSSFFLTMGLVQSLGFWLIKSIDPLSRFSENLLKYGDAVFSLAGLLLLAGTFRFFLRPYSQISSELEEAPLLLFLMDLPLLFIALTEITVSQEVYGNTIVWSSAQGIVHPVVNSPNLVFLHLLGYGGMFAILLIFQRLSQSIRKGRALRQLEFQAEQQKAYVLEAQARYDKTRAFRHDVKNHLLLLREMLSKGETERAAEYLSSLEGAAGSLSFPVRTNNMAVDFLLESKLLAARQYGTAVECSLEIPAVCPVQDMDWCVILANAMDNALEAGRTLPEGGRSIRINSRMKGDFFFLHIENSCQKDIHFTCGTGLSNIRTAVEKYGGVMEIASQGGTFQLDILFHLPPGQ